VLARLSVLCAFLALVAVVAGCGGGGTSTEVRMGMAPESAKGVKTIFIEEADGICSEYQAKREPIKAELEALEKVAEPESAANEKQIGALLNETLGDAEVELESIRELEVPPGDEPTIEKLIGTAEEGNSLVSEGATALEEGDTQRFGELAREGESVNARAKGIAEGYGLTVCGQAP
jgi:hypothetical protein